MKANKALKRLADVEASLSKVIDRYAGSEQSLKALLEQAKTCVVHASETVTAQAHKAEENGHAMKRAESNNRPHPAAKAKHAAAAAGRNGAPKKGVGRRSVSKRADLIAKQSPPADAVTH